MASLAGSGSASAACKVSCCFRRSGLQIASACNSRGGWAAHVYQLSMASASRTCWVFLMHSAETPDINSADTLGVLPPATTGFWTVKRGTCQGVFPNPHKSQAIQAKLTCPVCLVSDLRTVSDQLLSYLQTRAHSSPVFRGHREKRSPAQNSV